MKNHNKGRRDFIRNAGAAGIAAAVLPSFGAFASDLPGTGFTQKPLPYAYTALEPVIDAMTMEIHYSKHAAAYAKNLNDAFTEEKINTAGKSLESILRDISKYSGKIRNNGGGHYNHELFWQCMKPGGGSRPSGKLAAAIDRGFGSFDAFKTQFTDAGKNRFGSGWAWLVLNNDKKLVVGSTPNQDNPLMNLSDLKGTPLLGLDVWEHAYYLKYQNKRPDYINAWWNVVNWDYVEKRFESA
ncbi:superoxide dismutase [Sediminibacterium soli]|uniref:superoxide dismutase n=1 Tax=Sediminibacterium soli TaxID=2698829 RepID=UPI00137AEA81|nr:superoxide dismutase [Sediminibacterium soli]NCI47489.1 superoxide dismutase [Sediminibacterium soli]